MTISRAYEALFKEINMKLESHQIIIKKDIKIEASVSDIPLRIKKKKIIKQPQIGLIKKLV